MEGGAHENERRPGTENTAAIGGSSPRPCGVTATSIPSKPRGNSAGPMRFGEKLRGLGGIRRNGDPRRRVPNTLNVSFQGLHGEDLLIALDLAGLAVSSGSACLVGSVQPSDVLAAMGVPPEWAGATVRFSIDDATRDEDLEPVAQRVAQVVNHQRGLRGEGHKPTARKEMQPA